MSQLNLLDWAHEQSLLNDLGGRCAYCLESDNWLTTDEYSDEDHNRYYQLECQTVTIDSNGEFDDLCKNHKELIEVAE